MVEVQHSASLYHFAWRFWLYSIITVELPHALQRPLFGYEEEVRVVRQGGIHFVVEGNHY
jgi:hypothetical protein